MSKRLLKVHPYIAVILNKNSFTLLPILSKDPPRFAAALFDDCKEPSEKKKTQIQVIFNFE